jgi:hypothetical protein
MSIACPVAGSFGVSIGNEPRLTLITTSTSGSASRSDLLGFQCVYQSSIGIRSGFTTGDASSAKSGTMWIRTALGRVARGSVRAERARTNRTPRPTRGTGAERPQPHVRGQVVPPDGIAEDVDRLAAGGELAHDVHGLGEHRMVCVDLLGDEQDPHGSAGRAGDVASTSARISRASSSGVECQSHTRPGGRPHPLGELAVAEHARQGGCSVIGSAGGTSRPSTP